MKKIMLAVSVILLSWLFVFSGISWGVPSALKISLLLDKSLHTPGTYGSMVKARDVVYRDTKDHVLASPFFRTDEFAAQDRIVVDYKKTGETFRFSNYLRHFFLCSSDPDEAGVVNGLSNLKPAQRSFNPHHSFYGGGYFYPLAASLKALSLAGAIKLIPDMTYYFSNPDELGKFYTAARAAGAAAGVLGVFVLSLFALRLGRELFWPAVLAALCFLSPIVGIASKLMKPHFPLVLLSAACIMIVHAYLQNRDRRYLFSAYFVCGLMIGSIISSVVFGLLPVLACVQVWRETRPGAARLAKDIAAGLLLAAAGALLVNPYWAVTPGETLLALKVTNDKTPTNFNLESLLLFFRYGLGVPGLLAGTAVFLGIRQWKSLGAFNRVLLQFLVPAALLMGKIPPHPASARYCIFVLPAFLLFTTEVLRLQGRQKVFRALALVCLLLGAADAMRFRSYSVNDADPQRSTRILAAGWISANAGNASIGHIADLIPWTFPPIRLDGHKVVVYGDASVLLADKDQPDYFINGGPHLYGLTPEQEKEFNECYVLAEEFRNSPEILENSWRLGAQNTPIFIYRHRRLAAPCAAGA